jgi:hypothetical protein
LLRNSTSAVRELGRRGSFGKKPAKIVLELPSEIGVDFARAFDSRLVETTTPSWEFLYGLLERFAAREGHARVAAKHVEDEHQLGFWIANQRAACRAGRLSPERIARLESLPGWDWNPGGEAALGAAWEAGFSYLERFVAREHHARVTTQHLEDGYRLGQWVEVQRLTYRADRLSPERIACLEALPGWDWHPLDADWEEGFSHLERYVAREGNARVPRKHREDGYALGGWVNKQRAAHRAGRLSGQRTARLEVQPGWVWNPREADWEDGFSRLERFAAREGDTRVLPRHREGGYALGRWVVDERVAYRAGRLPPERIARLESLPGWAWNPLDADWEDGFSHLEHFAAREGHTRVPQKHLEDGYRLGGWVSEVRGTYRAGRLSPERIARLEFLPGWARNPFEVDWEEGFCSLERFAAREGHSRVPPNRVDDGYRLGQWIQIQRLAYRAGRLSPERIGRLESLPGWAWNPFEVDWEEGFCSLERFAAREGHTRVPQNHVENGYPLGTWVNKQRTVHRACRLSDERSARLEALPGWTWDARGRRRSASI